MQLYTLFRLFYSPESQTRFSYSPVDASAAVLTGQGAIRLSGRQCCPRPAALLVSLTC